MKIIKTFEAWSAKFNRTLQGAALSTSTKIIRSIIAEEVKRSNSGAEYIEINGKTVRTYTQNKDKSFNVIYDDGTKDTIMKGDTGWNEINNLLNAYELKESKLRPSEEEVYRRLR